VEGAVDVMEEVTEEAMAEVVEEALEVDTEGVMEDVEVDMGMENKSAVIPNIT
jgi:hypothetical protein